MQHKTAMPLVDAQATLQTIVTQLQRIEAELTRYPRRKGPRKVQQVLARSRNNRHTLGSLRLTDKGWSFSFAKRLLTQDTSSTLSLGIVLLYRARGLRPPDEHLVRYRHLQLQTPQREQAPASDDLLQARAWRIAQDWIPELAADKMPVVHWYHSSSRRVLGRYRPGSHCVGLHAACRLPQVPAYVLDDLLHHELLHAALGARIWGSRTVFHHSEFRQREAAFPEHARAENWVRQNLGKLLRAYRRSAADLARD